MVDLPPKDEWIATTSGVTRWRPVIDAIWVLPARRGKILRVKIGETTHEITLNQDSATHIGALLLAIEAQAA